MLTWPGVCHGPATLNTRDKKRPGGLSFARFVSSCHINKTDTSISVHFLYIHKNILNLSSPAVSAVFRNRVPVDSSLDGKRRSRCGFIRRESTPHEYSGSAA